MLLTDFPDLSWLKRQINLGFRDRIGVNGRILTVPGWPSVMLNVKSGEVHRDHITGPFSLFGNLKGSSTVQVGNRKVRVDSDFLFVTNPGQQYSLAIEKATHAETSNLHFGEYFADQLIQSQTSSVCNMLDNDFQRPLQPFAFHNRLIPKSAKVRELTQALCATNEALREEELMAQLFLEVFGDELRVRKSTRDLPAVQKSTRDELIKRILLAVDYIYAFHDQSLSLDELAQVGALSRFHFLRLFKLAMGVTPHQFITKVRISKSANLLKTTQQNVRQIAHAVGFPDSSSFSRAFHRHLGLYPSQYRSS